LHSADFEKEYVYFEDGIMKQSATDDYLTQILADADLAIVGDKSEVYWTKDLEPLHREMKKTDNPSKEDLQAFIEQQTPFLTNHRFYTTEANQVFPHKQDNIQFIKNLSISSKGE
jgi:hypothetical protein